MNTLNRAALASGAVVAPHAPLAARPVEILQIGEGVFMRGFVDWMVDVANEKGVYRGGVAVAAPRRHAEPPPLAAQDGLYTVLLRGREGGAEVSERRIVSAIQTVLDPYAQWPETIALAASPALKFLVSNTTEAGVVDIPEPYDPAVCPESFPAKVAALLKARYDALGGPEAPPLIVLPCELIEANGATLRRIVLEHARRWDFSEAALCWIGESCRFFDTLVDRIVPGFPTDEAERLFAEWGYRDPLAIVAEPFHLWVIEAPPDVAAALPLAAAGANVVWTDDVRPYRERKLRLLNGTHTATALAAFLAGLDTVFEMVEDPLFARAVERVAFEELAPSVPLPEAERLSYARSVIERFGNPFLRHELTSIAFNSVSKWRVRLLPPVRQAVAAGRSAPGLVAFSLAALLWFYRCEREQGGFVGRRAKGAYPIRDEPENLTIMAEAWALEPAVGAAAVAARLLADRRLWGEDLTKVGNLAALALAAFEAIERRGVRGALEASLASGAGLA
ncbi:tagaturonate reductase [Roseiarcus fermentans]|uniref:Tagaturonate reductase n=1 Tax=Roseiarcus fermentans TaxID=1473586 RepID=A0A366FUL7_9HYPH|nr:tagaturonate reductase [Roseiarcus fermentans]RBP18372.1 tagaturonate reductase [Roseiarcus fermentans]